MNGLKTIAALLIAAYAVPWATHHGLTLTADQQVEIIAGLAMLMRFVTTGPVAGDFREAMKGWLKARSSAPKVTQVQITSITPEVSALIGQAAAAELKQYFRRPSQPADPAPNGVTK
jgi:hypothetical protein